MSNPTEPGPGGAAVAILLKLDPRLIAVIERLKGHLGLVKGVEVLRFVLIEAARQRGLSTETEEHESAAKKSSTEAA